jgi:rod shape-determining protein MreD
MLILIFLLVEVVLIVTQTTIFRLFPAWLGYPDLSFIFIVFCAYRCDWVRGMLLVLALGWMMDVVSGLYLGTYPLLYFFLFLSLKFFKERSPVKEFVYQVPLVGVAFLLGYSALYVFYLLVLPGVLPEWSWRIIVQQSFILIVASIPCLLVCNRLYDQMEKKHFLSPRLLRRRSGNYFR